MALSNALPDRPLVSDELEQLQDSENFEQVQAGDSPGEHIDTIVVTIDGKEHMLHFAPQGGWHKHEHDH